MKGKISARDKEKNIPSRAIGFAKAKQQNHTVGPGKSKCGCGTLGAGEVQERMELGRITWD